MSADMTSRNPIVRPRDQRRLLHPSSGSGPGQPTIRGLLEAAGMAPVADESRVEECAFGVSGRGLPLIELHDTSAEGARYCVATTVNDRGRLADQTPLKLMDWPPGTPITISMIPSAGILIVRRTGADAVTRQGHLRLPANIRHGCRIFAGDRLLVVAHPGDGVLVGYTRFALDAMASAYHASLAAADIP